MSQPSEVRWGRWITIGGLLLLTRGVQAALPGLTRVARDEVFLRGGDAVLLFEPSAFRRSASSEMRPAKIGNAALPRSQGTRVRVARIRAGRAKRTSLLNRKQIKRSGPRRLLDTRTRPRA